MNPSLPYHSTLRFAVGLLSLASLFGSLAPAAEWLGTIDSDFSDASNWIETAPLAGQINAQVADLKVLNEKLHPLRYTARHGHTIVNSPGAGTGQFLVGTSDRAGRMEIAGGSLHIYSYWSPIVAQLGFGTTGTIHVNGGLLRISNTSRSRDSERFFRVGNTSPKPENQHANGALFISSGAMIIECDGGQETQGADRDFIAGGLNVGRGNGSGLIYLTGGKLTVTSPHGTSFVPDNGRACGILTFGLGDGVFEPTSSSRLTFGTNSESESYITFQSGSSGALSLAGATRELFEQHVREGHIRIEGGWVEMARFTFTQEGNQGVLRLASTRAK